MAAPGGVRRGRRPHRHDAANHADGDGYCESDETCDLDPGKQEPGQCGCGVPDTDEDADGVADCLDRCTGEDDTIDSDMDGRPDCVQLADAVPTVTQWGLVILALLLLTGMRCRFGRENRAMGP